MPPKVATTPRCLCESRRRSTRNCASGGVFSVDLVEQRDGFVVLEVDGVTAAQTFADEAGGHRWQRRPPNDRHDRTHTSTVTVAVMPLVDDADHVPQVQRRDITETFTRSSGSGGQKVNKTSSAVLLTHKPSGIAIRVESERSQTQNRRRAMTMLVERLRERAAAAQDSAASSSRRQQVGTGMRGDKRRTIAVQRSDVVDHMTGKRWSYKNYVRGLWD